MPAEINLSLDRRNLARFRMLLKANRQFAAYALTDTAKEAQADWRRAIPGDFHLRRKWLLSGVWVKYAKPGNLVSAVGHVDKYFGRHVQGVDLPKVAGRKRLFVPVQPIEEQGTHTAIRSMLRRADRSKRPTFRVRDMILRRARKGSNEATLLGVLRKSVDIEPRFDAVGITERAVQRSFSTTYERLLTRWAERG